MNNVNKSGKAFDRIIAMNLMALGVLGSGYAGKLFVQDIGQMTQTLKQQPKRLMPMPDVIEFHNGRAVARK